MIDTFEMGEVPFYWRVKRTALQTPHDVPACLPFAFSFIEDLQLFDTEAQSRGLAMARACL